MARASETPIDRIRAAIDDLPGWLASQPDSALWEPLVDVHEFSDRLLAAAAPALRRFDKSGEFRADGALSLVAWLRWKCNLAGGTAAERVGMARQLEQLPQTEKAFSRGDLGYQHVAILARTAEHVGASVVRKAETSLLKAAESMDPGQFTGVAKDFEHRVDPEGALNMANRAYERRYLHIGQPQDGMVRIDGLLDTEGGAIVSSAVNRVMMPQKDDARTPGQRRADALVEVCGGGAQAKHAGGSPRPQLIVRASIETLSKTAGSPAGRVDGAGSIAAETVRRLACDSAVARIVGSGELEGEISRASRSIAPATRRALEARDHHCVFGGCDRPPIWCDGHHLKHWADGGPTTLENLALLCRPHHRLVHEGGWAMERNREGSFITRSPKGVPPHSRSA